MTVELIFQIPEELDVDNNYLGKKFLFNYSIKYLVQSPEYDKIEEKKFVVSISNISLRRWDYKNESELHKVLFLHVFECVKEKLANGELNEIEKLDLKVSYEDIEKRYDPNKIPDFINVSFQIDLDESGSKPRNFKMGF